MMTRNTCMIVMTRRATFGDHENATARRVHAYFLKTSRKSRVFRSVRPQILPVLNYMDFIYFYFFFFRITSKTVIITWSVHDTTTATAITHVTGNVMGARRNTYRSK